MKKFPCRLCERSFCSAPSLRRHVRVNHEGIKRVYSCRHCTEGKRTFSSRLILEKHLQVIHGINVADHAHPQDSLFQRVNVEVLRLCLCLCLALSNAHSRTLSITFSHARSPSHNNNNNNKMTFV
uniref:C2H2-type domain-containing protein n=1 Tax=Callorhinchus milii TaxID=7868 RepID=A0A4W3GNQ4_CALMI